MEYGATQTTSCSRCRACSYRRGCFSFPLHQPRSRVSGEQREGNMARFPARRVGFLIWSIAALWLFGVAATANAAFPGDNGKIAVHTYASGFGSTNWDAF